MLYDGEAAYSAAADYGSGLRWATFRVLVDLGANSLTAEQIRQLFQLIEVWKNARSHLVGLGARLGLADELQAQAHLATTTRYQSEDVVPWGRRYDGSLRHEHGIRRLHDGGLLHDAESDHKGWGPAGVLYDNRRADLSFHLSLGAEENFGSAALHDGRRLYSGILHGADRPSVVDPVMPIRVTRHALHSVPVHHHSNVL